MGIKWAEYTEKTALYENDRVTKAQLQKRVEKGVISIDEYNYIVGEDVL
ncbi:Uncharacterised protein [[Ruminococcus] torques]|jgi:hypothetical protein|nr:Uncharacterised protein [[Ruminococcus] torques]